MKKVRYSLTPYAGNKASYSPILDSYDTIIDCFAGSLGGTIQTAIVNPHCNYLVAEKAPTQRSLIEGLNYSPKFYEAALIYAEQIIEEFFTKKSYSKAARWLSNEFDNSWDNPTMSRLYFAGLSVLRRFYFSNFLRTTPGSNNLNVWISVRKILGDKVWKAKCAKWIPNVDYATLNTEETKEFNAALAEYVFQDGSLKDAMIASVRYWHKSIQPLLTEWFSCDRHIEVFNDYSDLLQYSAVQGKTLLYIDPPYFNNNKGEFIDEKGRKRYHKQTPSYEHHDPRSDATWQMMFNSVQFGLEYNCDMVLCNYASESYTALIDAIRLTHSLEVIVDGKSCLGTGKRSRYTTAPMSKEFVLFVSTKIQPQVLVA